MIGPGARAMVLAAAFAAVSAAGSPARSQTEPIDLRDTTGVESTPQNAPGEPRILDSGRQVRVWPNDMEGSHWSGTLRLWPADTLYIDREEEPRVVAVPWSYVRRIDVSLGTKRQTGPGLLIGGLAGLVGGVIASAAISEGGGLDFAGVAALLAGPAVGMLLGGALGSRIVVERWKEIPAEALPPRR
jgi:hypothetical protein